MSICSDKTITRQDALNRVYKLLMYQQSELLGKAVNSMDNDDLAGYLHTDMTFYDVEGEEGKLLAMI